MICTCICVYWQYYCVLVQCSACMGCLQCTDLSTSCHLASWSLAMMQNGPPLNILISGASGAKSIQLQHCQLRMGSSSLSTGSGSQSPSASGPAHVQQQSPSPSRDQDSPRPMATTLLSLKGLNPQNKRDYIMFILRGLTEDEYEEHHTIIVDQMRKLPHKHNLINIYLGHFSLSGL